MGPKRASTAPPTVGVAARMTQLVGVNALARRPLVRKGDLVEVTVSEGRLSLTMKALAMENGAQGDVVTVRNTESRKDFVAVVTHENQVRVRF